MNKTDGKFFAYVAGLKGPVPVIFHDGIRQSELKTVLVKWDLYGPERQADLSIATLKRAFPFPVQQMEKPASQTENSGAP
jgi:hypothetical protein